MAMLDTVMPIVLAVIAMVAGLVVMAARQPDFFHIARTIRIDAPAERVFPLVADLKQMNTWNPFLLRDPACQGSYSENSAGVGARFDFAGPKAGAGHIEMTEVLPPSKVGLRLVMTKPFACDNRVEFTLERRGDAATDVSWALSGPQTLMGKVMGLFMSMDRMVGGPIEEGLTMLKGFVEARG